MMNDRMDNELVGGWIYGKQIANGWMDRWTGGWAHYHISLSLCSSGPAQIPYKTSAPIALGLSISVGVLRWWPGLPWT